jgi:hypothetical protein
MRVFLFINMENLEQFFKDNQRGYLRDPRRMAYAKLQKNTQGMDREQLEAFIKANLMIPHSQYKMALGNLIQFLKKQDQMGNLNEVKQLQKLAGLLKENHINSGDIKWSYPEINTDSEDFYYEYNPESEDYSISAAIYGTGVDGKKYKGLYSTNVPSLDNEVLDDLNVDPSTIKNVEQVEDMNELHPDKEWDEEDDQEETGEDYPSDEELFGLSEDDYSEDPSSDMDDESQSGDTDAMGIDEWAGMSPEHANTFDLMDKLKDFKKAGKLNDTNFKKAEDFIHKNAADLYYDYPDAEHALKHVFKTIKAGVAIGTEYTADSIVPAVQKLADELVAKGKYKPEQSKRVVAYAAKHKDELLKKLSSPIQWFNASAEKTQHGTK